MTDLTNPESPNSPPQKYGVLLFPGWELLDVFGPLEALQHLARHTHLELYFLSGTLDEVTSEGPPPAGTNPHNSSFWPKITPTHTLDNAPDLDVLLVPGGLGTRAPLERTVAWIAETYPKLQYLITVCTGSGLVARSGILDGRKATTNKASWSSIVGYGPRVNWVPHARWVVDGNIWTSSGISAGMDVTLAFIGRVYGEETATAIANRMEYERHTDPERDPFAELWDIPKE